MIRHFRIMSTLTALSGLLAACNSVTAEEGVVRMSELRSAAAASDHSAGVVRMTDLRQGQVTQTSWQGCTDSMSCGADGCGIGCGPMCAPGCQAPSACCDGSCEGCRGGDYCMCGPCCGCGPCGWCDDDDCDFGAAHRNRMCRLFAGSDPSCCDNDSRMCSYWRGQRNNFHSRNQRLADHLFGWLVPSGFCGQGAPPCGKYQITYADQPDYADPRDGQSYAAQGYGVPVTVPISPLVRYQYNYSWGTPASRLTPLSTYNPATSPQQLWHQTW